MDRLLSIGEAAAVKGVSIDTLRRWEKEGKIQSDRERQALVLEAYCLVDAE
ncbi:MAG: MerR family DNA-binding transcriptional regulator [Coleofasciculus sp. G1-WW12-02]